MEAFPDDSKVGLITKNSYALGQKNFTKSFSLSFGSHFISKELT